MSRETYDINIRRLLAEKYQRVNALPTSTKEMIIDQLWWTQQSDAWTPQSDVVYDRSSPWQQHINRELFRALSRIENLLLLQSVQPDNFDKLYQEFTTDQSAEECLTTESFLSLSEFFKQLLPAQTEAQMRATLVSTVALSPEAIERANQIFGEKNWPYDSVRFSGFTITKQPDMYPCVKSANETIQDEVSSCFPDDVRHWRHAFFLENNGALTPIKKQLEETGPSAINKIETWITYWLVNILGFTGHTKTLTGSAFLTESVYQRASFLNEAIRTLYKNPEANPLSEYSQRCLEHLHVKPVSNDNVAIFIIRLLNMANIFNSQKAQELTSLILSDQQYVDLSNQLQKIFQEKFVTFLPAFLQNISDISNRNLNTLLDAVRWATIGMETSTAEIISFRLIKIDEIQMLLDSQFESTPEINANGEITLAKSITEKLSRT